MKQFSLDVLYEDNHLLILNKPNGILTQPDDTGQESLEVQAKEWIKEKYQKPGNVFLHAAHRIDKPVSGIVVFCKTSKSLSRMNESIRNKQMNKTYRAWVEGKLPQKEGVLEHFLIHDDFCAKVVTDKTPYGKFAKLSYRVLESSSDRTFLEINLETGRYHQIRIQFSAIGHPICGDSKYGAQTKLAQHNAIALHHYCLEFIHPVSRERIVITASSSAF